MKSIEHLTKRELLLEIACTYDPCGWSSPLIIVSKILVQHIWQKGASWDKQVIKTILDKWILHRRSYNHLKDLQIFYVNTTVGDASVIYLNGFCDSLERAFAVDVYIILVIHHIC